MLIEALVVIKSIIKVLRPLDGGLLDNPEAVVNLQNIYQFVLKKSADANVELNVREQGTIDTESHNSSFVFK